MIFEYILFATAIFFIIILIAYLGNLFLFLFIIPYFGTNATVSNKGIKLFSKVRKNINCYTWKEISHFEYIFKPPFYSYHRMYVKNNTYIKLSAIDSEYFFNQVKQFNSKILNK